MLLDPPEWLREVSISDILSSDEDMQFSPPPCITPPLTYSTPDAPNISPLSSLESTLQSPGMMSTGSNSDSYLEAICGDEILTARRQESVIDSDRYALAIGSNQGMTSSTTRPTTEEVMPSINSSWFGFKIVGDNIDKNIHPRHQTIDSRTKSLHYFHAFAALVCVDLSS